MLRRAFLGALGALPFLGWLKPTEAAPCALLSTHKPPVGSMDALEWAESFVAHVKANPSIATDEACMIGWFANAIMAGYDEGNSQLTCVEGFDNTRQQVLMHRTGGVGGYRWVNVHTTGDQPQQSLSVQEW